MVVVLPAGAVVVVVAGAVVVVVVVVLPAGAVVVVVEPVGVVVVVLPAGAVVVVVEPAGAVVVVLPAGTVVVVVEPAGAVVVVPARGCGRRRAPGRRRRRRAPGRRGRRRAGARAEGQWRGEELGPRRRGHLQLDHEVAGMGGVAGQRLVGPEQVAGASSPVPIPTLNETSPVPPVPGEIVSSLSASAAGDTPVGEQLYSEKLQLKWSVMFIPGLHRCTSMSNRSAGWIEAACTLTTWPSASPVVGDTVTLTCPPSEVPVERAAGVAAAERDERDQRQQRGQRMATRATRASMR